MNVEYLNLIGSSHFEETKQYDFVPVKTLKLNKI